MFEDDATYYTRRADAELRLAQRATTCEAAFAHQQLAEAYLKRVVSNNQARTLEPASPRLAMAI